MDGIYVAVGQYNVVHAFGDGLFGFLAQAVKRFLQSCTSFGDFKQYRQLYSLEAFIADVAENIQLRIRQDGWFSRTILQWLSLGVSMFMPTAPMYSVRDITNSSRIGSIGGLVTCANCWRK